MLIYLQMIESEEDRTKFTELYQRYRRLMFSVAYDILHESYDAEDAVHQAFLSLINNLEKVRQIDSPETRGFLIVITENKAIDIIRKRIMERNVVLENDLPGIDIPLPEDGGLAVAMAKLPAQYREVLLLRYGLGYSAHEISKILDLEWEAVRKRIQRAKTALKKLLDEEEEEG